MEKLAMTCKILYDKDWLDNIKLCKDGQVKPVIKYESIHDLSLYTHLTLPTTPYV